jgi:hypothetical protein
MGHNTGNLSFLKSLYCQTCFAVVQIPQEFLYKQNISFLACDCVFGIGFMTFLTLPAKIAKTFMYMNLRHVIEKRGGKEKYVVNR